MRIPAHVAFSAEAEPPPLRSRVGTCLGGVPLLHQHRGTLVRVWGAGEEMCVGSEEVAEVQAYKGLPEGAQQLVSSIRKMDAESPKEIVRARTTWVKQ